MRVRVADVYEHDGKPEDIDVYAGATATGGTKLATVRYGAVSDELTPLTDSFTAPETDSGEIRDSYDLSFYVAGRSSQSDQIIEHGEDGYQGDVVTIVIGPDHTSEPGNARSGGSMEVLFEKSGSKHATRDVAFADVTATGGALVLPVALGVDEVQSASGDAGSSAQLDFDLGAGGSCIPQVTTDKNPLPGRASFNVESFSNLYYRLDPSTTTIGVHAQPGVVDCTGAPAVSASVDGNAGDHVILLVYGEPTALHVLSVKAAS